MRFAIPSRVDAIADTIRSILRLEGADLEALRARCSRAAAERWNWDWERKTPISVCSEIMPRRE